MSTSSSFQEGSLCLLVDSKGRRYLLRLRLGGVFHFHRGMVPHETLIGRNGGLRLTSSGGEHLVAVSPTLSDFVMKMPRRTQIIYPKDVGAILVYADIFPGATVLEVGMGSGSLTMALLRAVGAEGRVIAYEVRAKAAQQALDNIASFMGGVPDSLTVRIADVYEGIEERDLDRAIFDVAEPWHAVPTVAQALRPGGIFLSYLPTALQLHQLGEALRAEPAFALMETMEVMLRPWHVAGRSVRPAHRMVAHTGFITVARNVSSEEIAASEAEEHEPLPTD